MADLWVILTRGRRWIIGATLATMVGVGLLVSGMPPRYQAQGVLVSTGGPALTTDPGGPRTAESPLSLQRLAESPGHVRAMAAAVLANFQLPDERGPVARLADGVLANLGLAEPWQGPTLASVEGMLRDNMRVWADEEAGTLSLAYTASDPKLASDVANFLMRYVLEDRGQEREGRHAAMAGALEGRISELRQSIQTENEALSRLRAGAGLDAMPTGSVLDMRVAEAIRTLSQESAQVAAAEARLDRARRSLDRGSIDNTGSGVVLSPLLEKLHEERAAVSQRLAALDTEVGPNHPARKAAAEELARLDKDTKAERDRLLYELGGAVRAAKARERRAKEALDGLSLEAAKLLPDRLGIGAAEARLKGLQAAHDEVLRSLQEHHVVARAAGDAVKLSAAAVPPEKPLGPRKKLAVAMAGMVALALSSLACLFRGIMSGQRASGDRYRQVVGARGVYELSTRPPRIVNETWREMAGRGTASSPALDREVRDMAAWLLSQRTKHGLAVTVSSPLPREGKTMTSALLALGATGLGAKTLVLDCDSYTHAMLGRLREAGALGEATHVPTPPHPPFMVHGTRHPNLWAAALDGPALDSLEAGEDLALRAWLGHLARVFDLIVIDAPPILVASEATTLARASNLNVLVHDASRGTVDALARAASLNRMFGIRTDMLVLSRFRTQPRAYGPYYGKPRPRLLGTSPPADTSAGLA